MASEAVTTKAGELCTALVAKAKQYRLANINARMTSSGTAGFGVDSRLEAKKSKIEADDASVTWAFATRAAGDDIEIVGTAPADRGGVVKVWGFVTSDGDSVRMKQRQEFPLQISLTPQHLQHLHQQCLTLAPIGDTV